MNMTRALISKHFSGVAAKRLRAVEANPSSSNQHEFNGVKELRELLGTARLTDYPATFVWLGDEDEAVSEEVLVTWYDARQRQGHRAPEYRLYFRDNPVMELATEGDLLVVAKMRSEGLMIIVAPAGSTVENQLLWLFGVPIQLGTSVEYRDFRDDNDREVGFAARYILEELGVGIEEPEADKLDPLLDRFGLSFPTTHEFSSFARNTLPDVSPLDDPDMALLAWLEREELLFRRLERRVVAERLREGFISADEVDVDGFIGFSLSVQNRRKSRIGHAFENHLEEIFKAFGLSYSRQAVTENRSRPDFLFPGSGQYHDPGFPVSRLTMLGVKSTCKDRWRQILAEAAKIREKHLVTVEPGISVNQTAEMKTSRVQLVIPRDLQQTYTPEQRGWLLDLRSFIDVVQSRLL
jgi:hypothetical protein